MYRLNKSEKEFRERNRGEYAEQTGWSGLITQFGRARAAAAKLDPMVAAGDLDGVLFPQRLVKSKQAAVQQGPPPLLFPCYLFVRCRMTDPVYMGLTELAEIQSVLGKAFRIPSIVPDEEIEQVRGLQTIDATLTRIENLHPGSAVEVTEGPMRGARGRLIERQGDRAKLQLGFSFLDPSSAIVFSLPVGQIRTL